MQVNTINAEKSVLFRIWHVLSYFECKRIWLNWVYAISHVIAIKLRDIYWVYVDTILHPIPFLRLRKIRNIRLISKMFNDESLRSTAIYMLCIKQPTSWTDRLLFFLTIFQNITVLHGDIADVYKTHKWYFGGGSKNLWGQTPSFFFFFNTGGADTTFFWLCITSWICKFILCVNSSPAYPKHCSRTMTKSCSICK